MVVAEAVEGSRYLIRSHSKLIECNSGLVKAEEFDF